jgi:hypothetical protein
MFRNISTHLLVLAGLALLFAAGAGFERPGVAWAKTTSETSPAITLSPATALPNQSVAITGTAFTTGGNSTVSGISIGGTPVSGEKINFGKVVNIASGGNFVTNLIVPVNSNTLNSGSVTVAVTDSAGVTASASLTISKPTITVSPTSGRVGSKITVTGSSFPIDSSSVGSDDIPEITLEYETSGGQFLRVATVFSGSTGGFTASFTIPSDAGISSDGNQIRASLEDSSAEITTTHSIVASTISLSPVQGPPGTAVSMVGANFEAFALLESLSIGNLGVDISTSLYTDGNGGFNTTFEVPEMEAGSQSLILAVGGLQYTQTFTVQSSTTTSEVDDYSPAPRKFEVRRAVRPLEDNLIRVFYFDNGTKQWSFYDPQPGLDYFNTLTELVEGQVYWMAVREDRTLLIQGSLRTFIAGWNLIVW